MYEYLKQSNTQPPHIEMITSFQLIWPGQFIFNYLLSVIYQLLLSNHKCWPNLFNESKYIAYTTIYLI